MKEIKNEFKDFTSHIDMMNTIGGGTSLTSIDIDKNPREVVIKVSAPSVDGDAFNILLKGNQLIVFTNLNSEMTQDSEYGIQKMPLFSKTFDLPLHVNREAIDAIYEDDQLHIVLPLTEMDQEIKKIDIRH